MKINLLVLRTSKLEELRGFYENLGANFQKEKHGNGPEHYAATLADGFVLEIYPIRDGAISDNNLRIGLKVDDIEKALGLLDQAATPKQSPWGLRAIVRDPDGRTIELIQCQSEQAGPQCERELAGATS